MSTASPVCAGCGATDQLRPVAARHLCPVCWRSQFGPALAAYRLEVDGHGTMLQHGRLRPDHGPGWAECQCSACGATAVAPPGEPCGWCIRSLDRLRRWQAEC